MINNTPVNIEPIVAYMKAVPFDVRPQGLYTPFSLYEGFNPDEPATFETCFDTRVYRHFIENGKHAKSVGESFSRTMHDYAVHVALDRFFSAHDHLLCVGVMGGHALKRTDPMFRQIAFLAKRLTRMGFYMVTGGGPGAMEATHLGAWMAEFLDDELDDALSMLSVAPHFTDPHWLSSAFQVIQKYPQSKYESLGIPTWLYGHEPSTPFATHIAKLFENSIREDSILTLAYGGIIYTPGSAGTMQEIFQEAVQNHYQSFGFSSPMVFLGQQFWTEELPAYNFLEELQRRGKYKNLLLSVTDEAEDVVAELLKFQHEANVYPDKFKMV